MLAFTLAGLGGCAHTESDAIEIDEAYSSLEFCDVVPLIEKTCLRCHIETGIGPFPLVRASDFQRKKRTIMEVLSENIMPPWKPDPHYMHFKNEYYLDSVERKKLYNWVHFGAKDSSKCQLNRNNAKIISYDKSGECFDFTFDYKIPSNDDNYHCVVFPNPFNEDVYLQSINILPTNKTAVHHISAFIKPSDSLSLACQEHGNCECDPNTSVLDGSNMIASWILGNEPFRLDSNLAFIFPKDAYLIVQTHYAGGFIGDMDSQSICFEKTASDTSTVKQVFFKVEQNMNLDFPANTVMWDTVVTDVPEKIKMISIWPHTHHLAREVECYAITADNQKIPLIKINDWDYLWQSSYEFLKEVEIPAGSKVYMVVRFDNTEENPRNPYSPPKPVKYGLTADDEMLVIAYTYYHP